MEMRHQIFMFNSNNEIELVSNSEQLDYKINLSGALKDE